MNVIRVILLLSALQLSACTHLGEKENLSVNNVILMIGDGMGPQQLGLLLEYARRGHHPLYMADQGMTAFDRFAVEGFVGMSLHSPADVLVTDSACSASQLASGVFSGSEMIGLDAEGNPVRTVLEQAKLSGRATGLVSDTRITHATPAAFAAHQRHRSMENEIALEMLGGEAVDVMLSGGLRHWLPVAVNTDLSLQKVIRNKIDSGTIEIYSKREDGRNLLDEAEQAGYQLVFNRQQLEKAKNHKVIGLFAASGMQDAISYHQGRSEQPSLAQMTAKALNLLAQNDQGFFLMVEGGQIDWAGHNNDAGTLLHEMVRFDEAVRTVYDWVQGRDDTLVIITADHETGGFGFSYSRYGIPEARPLSGAMFAGHRYQPNFNFARPEILDRLYRQRKSFYRMLRETKQDGSRPSAVAVMNAVNDNSDFKITLRQAERIVATEVNEYRVEQHPYLSEPYFPAVQDFKEFYVYGEAVHLSLIGRALAREQNVVWSTGTHTHTPVPVIAWGRASVASQFSTLLHHTDIGRMMMSMLGKE